MTVVEAFDESIEEIINDGVIDRKKQGALIEAARKLAMMLDDPEWPIVRGKLDNVSPTVFLKYCEKLGMAVEVEKSKKESATTVIKDNSGRIVGMSKWKKQA